MKINRIRESILSKSGKIISIYLTAGFPKLDDTVSLVCELSNLGIDFVEIGIPFSDPVADGPTIQSSSEVALKNGISLHLVLDQVSQIRLKSDMPIVLMGYLNPVMQYGIENFCRECKERDIDGVILPDLPIELYIEQYKSIFDEYGIDLIFLVTSQSTEDRIRMIDRYSNSFIYVVSSAAVTGGNLSFDSDKYAYLKRLKEMKLNSPLIVGFGISSKQDLLEISKIADGGIIGSAFIRAISSTTDPIEACRKFVQQVI